MTRFWTIFRDFFFYNSSSMHRNSLIYHMILLYHYVQSIINGYNLYMKKFAFYWQWQEIRARGLLKVFSENGLLKLMSYKPWPAPSTSKLHSYTTIYEKSFKLHSYTKIYVTVFPNREKRDLKWKIMFQF